MRETVVVTGASAGVGRATAREFARHGARVGLIAREPSRLAATADEVAALGGIACAIPADVADPDQIEAAAAEIEGKLGAIDVWVNNAMTTVFSRVVDLAPEELRRVTDVTYHGTVWGTLAALRRMVPRGRGVIVQVGSALAHRSIPLQAAYCAAKHAIRGFTDSLRCELLHDDIDVHLTMVQLPALNTPQFGWCRSHMDRKARPAGAIYQPEVAASAIYWAAHHRRRETMVGRTVPQAVLGNKVAPGLLDHYLARTAVDGQLLDDPEPPQRPSNLFVPVLGDVGARGAFDDQAISVAPSAWLGSWLGAFGVRAAAAAAVLALAAAVVALVAGTT